MAIFTNSRCIQIQYRWHLIVLSVFLRFSLIAEAENVYKIIHNWLAFQPWKFRFRFPCNIGTCWHFAFIELLYFYHRIACICSHAVRHTRIQTNCLKLPRERCAFMFFTIVGKTEKLKTNHSLNSDNFAFLYRKSLQTRSNGWRRTDTFRDIGHMPEGMRMWMT